MTLADFIIGDVIPETVANLTYYYTYKFLRDRKVEVRYTFAGGVHHANTYRGE